MTKDEKIEVFNQRWDLLIKKISQRKEKYRGKKAICLKDFYFSKASVKKNDEYDCLECYNARNIPTDEHEAHRDAFIKGRKVCILKTELLNYYLNGWNKSDELEVLNNNYLEFKRAVAYYNRIGRSGFKDEYSEAYNGLRSVIREKNRIGTERTSVRLLLSYLGLVKKEDLK